MNFTRPFMSFRPIVLAVLGCYTYEDIPVSGKWICILGCCNIRRYTSPLLGRFLVFSQAVVFSVGEWGLRGYFVSSVLVVSHLMLGVSASCFRFDMLSHLFGFEVCADLCLVESSTFRARYF